MCENITQRRQVVTIVIDNKQRMEGENGDRVLSFNVVVGYMASCYKGSMQAAWSDHDGPTQFSVGYMVLHGPTYFNVGYMVLRFPTLPQLGSCEPRSLSRLRSANEDTHGPTAIVVIIRQLPKLVVNLKLNQTQSPPTNSFGSLFRNMKINCEMCIFACSPVQFSLTKAFIF